MRVLLRLPTETFVTGCFGSQYTRVTWTRSVVYSPRRRHSLLPSSSTLLPNSPLTYPLHYHSVKHKENDKDLERDLLLTGLFSSSSKLRFACAVLCWKAAARGKRITAVRVGRFGSQTRYIFKTAVVVVGEEHNSGVAS